MPGFEDFGGYRRVYAGPSPADDPLTAPLDALIAASGLAGALADGRRAVAGIAGPVAAGKTTAARALKKALERALPGAGAEILSTDGFLYPAAALRRAGVMDLKGFPVSYDYPALFAFLRAFRAGGKNLAHPVYSHELYDVLPEPAVLRDCRILIIEGVNVLCDAPGPAGGPEVRDFLDLSVYLHAGRRDLRRWFEARFARLVAAAGGSPGSAFARFAALPAAEVRREMDRRWFGINLRNLEEHIGPSARHAGFVVRKNGDHTVAEVLRREPRDPAGSVFAGS